MKNNIQGVGVALITPFKNNFEVDYDALGSLINYVSDGGVDYLVALGTTGETPTLTRQEQDDILKYIKQHNKRNLPLVVGIGGNSTSAVINAINAADLSGVDAVLSVTPYYNKPTQQGLYEHYKAIALNTSTSIMLYNVPGRTGVNMLPDTTVRLAKEFPNIIGVKEACGSLSQMCQLLKNRPQGFKVISGDDAMLLSLNHCGGDGVISVAANAFPLEFSLLHQLSCNGDVESAASLNLRLFEMIESLFEEGNPAGVKAALVIKGMINNVLRLPLMPASDRLMQKIENLMRENNL